MKRSCIKLNTNTEEQNASSIRPLKINFVRMKITNHFFSFLLIVFSVLSCNNKFDKHITNKQEYLQYLNSLEGKGALSGQFIRWAHNASLDEITEIHDSSGKWVAMLGADYYSNFQDSIPSPTCAYRKTNDVLIPYLKNDGCVNLTVHFINPQNGGSAWNSKIDFDSLFIEGSRVQKNFYRELDSVAVGLKELNDSGIVTIFRPFHEMNGSWFWWGKQTRYKELWMATYHYINTQKGLNNLIWCYSPDAGQPDILEYYPGDEYVDITGLDAYTPQLYIDTKSAYEKIITFNKPFGFTEYGCVRGGDKTADTLFDYSIMVEWLKNDFPKALFFLAWRDHWGMAYHKNEDKLLNHPYIINLKPAR